MPTQSHLGHTNITHSVGGHDTHVKKNKNKQKKKEKTKNKQRNERTQGQR
jgi:hypothetical protein